MNYEKRTKEIYELLNGTDMSVDIPIEVLYSVITTHYNEYPGKDPIEQAFLLVQAMRTWVYEMKEEIEL